MNEKILNITNGDAFNTYFISKFGGRAVPFREAMMDGETVSNIFSEEFVEVRSQELGVAAEEYRKNMLVYDALRDGDHAELCLWFGKDTFCQMNLLTLLAYLEQAKYSGVIKLNYIDDESFDTIDENIRVYLGIYNQLYERVIISKKKADKTGVILPRAIDLYFDYLSDDGALSNIVRDNLKAGEADTLTILLQMSKEYGISDIQAQKLIERHKKAN